MFNIIFFACAFPVVPIPFVKDSSLSINGFNMLTRYQLTMDIWLCVWILKLAAFIHMSTLMPISHWKFVVSLEIGKCQYSKFILPFQDCFGIQSLLQFYMEFGINISISAEEIVRIADNLKIPLGSIADFIILNHPIYEHDLSFHSFMSP